MRWIVSIIALLVLAVSGIARAADELPASGAALVLTPTATGYEARINLPSARKFVGARISSTDAILAPLLEMKAWPVDGDATRAPAPASADQPLKLLVVTLKSGAIPQGRYSVTVSFAAESPETRDFLLVVPAAKVDPIDTLIVYRYLGGGKTIANQPQILESTGKQWITNISFLQKGNTDAGPEPAGRLQPKGKIADLPPGGSGLIQLDRDYDLVGSFPLGVAKGKLVLKADQIAEPVNFAFEIQSRIWFVWMLAPMVLGLGLGATSRTWLTGRVNLAREREKPFALLALIEAALARNADAQFQKAAHAAQDQAAKAARETTVEKVRTATTAAQSAYDNALAALSDRRSAFDKALAEFRAVVDTPYRLPKALAQSLADERQRLDAGLEGVATNDVAKAERGLADARSGLAARIVDDCRAWEGAMAKLVTAVESVGIVAGAGVAADVAKNLRASVESVARQRQQIAGTPLPTVETVKAALGALHASLYGVESLLSQLGSAIEEEVARATRLIGRLALRNEPAWRRWTEEARGRAVSLTKLEVADPAQVTGSMDAGTWDLLPALLDAVRAQLEAEQKDEAAKLISLAEQGGPSAAAKGLADLLREPSLQAKSPGRVQVSAMAPQEVHEEAPIETTASMASIRPLAIQPPNVSLGYLQLSRDGSPSTAVLAAVNRHRIETSGWILTCIYAAVIIVGGYFLFAAKWIGTPADFAAVFFWAFAIDVGADAAVSAAKGVRS